MIRLLVGLILAAWLGPMNYGIMAQAMVYVVLAAVFLDQGLGVTLVQKQEISRSDQGSVFLMTAFAGVLAALATLLLADPFATFFGTDELAPVLRVLAITVLLRALTVVPQALIVRRLRFKRLAGAELSGVVVGGVVGLLAASRWS